MGRKRGNTGLLQTFLYLPWWASLLAGGFFFGLLRWLAPAMLERPVFAAVTPMLRSLAWLPLVLFLFIAMLAALRSRTARGREDHAGHAGHAGRAGRRFAARRVAAGRPDLAFGTASGRASSTASGGAFDAAPDVAAVHARSVGTPASAPDSTPDRAAHATMNDHAETSAAPEIPLAWTLQALRSLEWKRFELLCADYYALLGFRSVSQARGADGGVDVRLYKDKGDGDGRGEGGGPLAIVQCKAWNGAPVSVKPVRELLGSMAHEKVARGIFITTGNFTRDAVLFAQDNAIQLLDGEAFLYKLLALPAAQSGQLLAGAFAGDYLTPTCPSCGEKTLKRDSQRGPFWGCRNFPRCRITFRYKPENAPANSLRGPMGGEVVAAPQTGAL
jgi:restriction system protein